MSATEPASQLATALRKTSAFDSALCSPATTGATMATTMKNRVRSDLIEDPPCCGEHSIARRSAAEAQQAEGGRHEQGAADTAGGGGVARLHRDARHAGRGGAAGRKHDELGHDRGGSEDQKLGGGRP